MTTVRIFYKLNGKDRYTDVDGLDSVCDLDHAVKRLKRKAKERHQVFEFVTWHIVKTEVVEDQT